MYLSLFSLLIACSPKSTDTSTQADPLPVEPETVWELQECELSYSDAYDLEGMTFQGNELTVNVAYSGGCETHHWELCWNSDQDTPAEGPFNLELGHNANGDTCEAYPSETLVFDVSALGEDAVSIIINGMEVAREE